MSDKCATMESHGVTLDVSTSENSSNSARKKRIRNFVQEEDDILLLVCEKYLETLLNKHTNNSVRYMKIKAWQDIERKFNSLSTFEARSAEDLKMRWENMKKYNKRVDGTASRPPDYKPGEDSISDSMRRQLEDLEKATDGVTVVELAMPLTYATIEIPEVMLDDSNADPSAMSASGSPWPMAGSSSEMDASSGTEYGKRRITDGSGLRKKCKRPLENAVSDELSKYLKRKSQLEQEYMYLLKNRLLEKWELEAQDRERKLQQEEEQVEQQRKYAADEEQRKVELHALQIELLQAKINSISQNK